MPTNRPTIEKFDDWMRDQERRVGSVERRARRRRPTVEEASTSGLVPAGSIILWSTSTAPSGFVICNGAAVSRTGQATLFGVIGTTYGVGDGSTTFNVPNLKGRVPVGFDSVQTEFDSLGETGGEKTHVLTIPEMPSHVHGFPGGAQSIVVTLGSVTYFFNAPTGPLRADPITQTDTAGSNVAHNNLQPYIALNYIIKT